MKHTPDTKLTDPYWDDVREFEKCDNCRNVFNTYTGYHAPVHELCWKRNWYEMEKHFTQDVAPTTSDSRGSGGLRLGVEEAQ